MPMREDQTLGELFTELARDMRTLVRQETEFARVEISQKAREAGKDIAFLAVGGLVAYAGFLALIAAAVFGLGEVMPLGLSALLVGVIVAGVGYFLVQKGLNQLKRTGLAPTKTIAEIKEDAQWLKDQTT